MASTWTRFGIDLCIRWRVKEPWYCDFPPFNREAAKLWSWRNFARTKGRFDEVHRSLFKAFFEDGRDLGKIEVLVEIANSVGFDREEVRAALGDGLYRARVLHDEQEALALGITGVPTAVVSPAEEPLEGAEVITGAQPYEVLSAAVERVLPTGLGIEARARWESDL